MRDLREQNWNIYARISRKRSGLGLLGYIWNEWISTFIILILLLMTLIIGTGNDPRSIITYRGTSLW